MSEWKEIQLGKLGKTYTGISGKTKDDFGSGKPYIPYLNVFQNNKIKPSQLDYVNINPDEKQNQVKYGDLFFTTSSETIEEVGMTSVLLHDLGEVYLNSFCFGFRLYDFENILPEYVPFLFRSDEIRHKISLQGQGSTRYNLSKTELLKKLILNLPTLLEQTSIAEILSTADEAIAHTEALIAKYQRIKTGLMQDLLTKGIDENGNIRSKATHKFVIKNGIEVPEEWEVKPLRAYLKYISYGFTNPMPETEEGPYMVTAANINDGKIIYTGCRHTSWTAFNTLLTPKSKPQIDDILITKDGSLGRLAIVKNEQLCINQSVAVLRIDRTLISIEYLKMLLESPYYQSIIIGDAGGSTIKHIYITKLDKMFLAIPKEIEEQEKILQLIGEQANYINELQKELSKFNSLKTGLMQDLLSGKVRVNMDNKN